MLIQHAASYGVLRLTIPGHLDVPNRAAAALQIEMLLVAHRALHVWIRLSAADPSPASLSVLARARRLSEGLGIPLTVVAPPQPSCPAGQRPPDESSPLWESTLAHEHRR
ncbi:hypothetical protein OG462_44340 [Streptomyces sp. NBC_01077]|uniref:hypothetical protein n=1 Tax=Streptomyces sp. NBC_01077 TaxID=2903746 RepID=UPI003864BD49|nr:hypothetical protein OG462_00660 [Streptomyces sp. NBC_01077]WSV43737.1 hypothetical protein OG462_44340 [Streptomyces sp. NBC_01077]